MPKADELKGRLAEEQRCLFERQKTINEVHKNYAKFGSRVVQVVLHYASHPTGIRDLVSKLPVSVLAGNSTQIHGQILRYIHDFGVSAFLAAASHQSKTPHGKTKQAVETKSPEPPSAPTQEAPGTPTVISADGQWVWLDRRTRERRSKKVTRRARVDSIFKNRRFGGERRAHQDRRFKLTPPPWPVNLKPIASP